MNKQEWYQANKHKWRDYKKKWASVHPERHHQYRRNSVRNYRHRSQVIATQAYEPWGPVEDAMLFSDLSYGELVIKLGRSVSAIGSRKRRLLLLEDDNLDRKTGKRLRP